MGTRQRFGRCLVVATVAAAFAILTPLAFSADKPSDKPKDAAKLTKKEQASKANVAQDAKNEARGRLPAYYRQVVDDAQRDKIYAIQQKYRANRVKLNEEIKRVTSDLHKQLAALKEKQDSEIAALLTAEQRSQLEKLRAAAVAERKRANGTKKVAPKKRAASKE